MIDQLFSRQSVKVPFAAHGATRAIETPKPKAKPINSITFGWLSLLQIPISLLSLFEVFLLTWNLKPFTATGMHLVPSL
jgi:hypothetical protein